MRFADAQMAFPDILLAILMAAALGGNALNLILVLGISRWMVYARVVFGLTRTLKQRPFVEAATLYGGNDRYIMRRHILPQVAPVLIVVATLQVAQMILQETALSFLGLGLPPPAATWGNILAEGRHAPVHRAVDRQLRRAGDHPAGLGRQHARQRPARALRPADGEPISSFAGGSATPVARHDHDRTTGEPRSQAALELHQIVAAGACAHRPCAPGRGAAARAPARRRPP